MSTDKNMSAKTYWILIVYKIFLNKKIEENKEKIIRMIVQRNSRPNGTVTDITCHKKKNYGNDIIMDSILNYQIKLLKYQMYQQN